MRKLSLLFAVCLFSAVCVFAQNDAEKVLQGSLLAVDKKGEALGDCPLKRTRVTAGITGFIARVDVVQEFENSFTEPIEAVYTFPLSQTAAVDRLTMRIGGRTIRGRILKKEEARKIYESAKNRGDAAALLNQERPNVFTQSVANILPGEKIEIEISYVETLKFEGGSYEFVFPMTVGPRYIPDSIDAEEAEKISPPVISETRAGHDISIEVNLNAGVPVEDIRSTSHEIESLNLSPNAAKISLRGGETIPNKDFVLRYDVTERRLEDAVLTNYGKNGGFFSLILSPPEKLAPQDVAPKEIVFVLDTSGSMFGFPLEKAKEAMKLALEGLYPDDTFNLITFSGDTHILFDRPVPATRANLDRAQEFLDSRSGSGGTEMMKAVRAALAPSDSQEHVRIVCFMTDGHVGNDFEIISEVKKHPNARVFSFGIGDSVNRFLLDQMAVEGRGEVEYVSLNDDGSRAARRFHERVRNPFLTDISIEWNDLPVSEIYPKRIPDLFDAKPVVVFGRYSEAASGNIKLKGKIGGQAFEREIAVELPAAETPDDVMATLWARARIDDLMAQNWDFNSEAVKETPRLKNEITKLGIDYGLMTQFTSFVAVEERLVRQNGKTRTVRVPAYVPAEYGSGSGDGVSTGYGYGSGSGFRTGRGAGSGNVAEKPAISSGSVTGNAVSLPKPAYPAAARAVNANGKINVQVTIDETGNVITAKAVSGHPLLRQAAEKAALKAKFTPSLLSGNPIKVTGVITYDFQDPERATNAAAPSVEEIHEQTEEEKAETARLLAEKARIENLAEKLHVWLFDLLEKPENDPAAAENLNKFIDGGRAKIQIVFNERTPEMFEKLKAAGFEILRAKNQRVLFGRIETANIAKLAEIGEIKYILPNIR